LGLALDETAVDTYLGKVRATLALQYIILFVLRVYSYVMT